MPNTKREAIEKRIEELIGCIAWCESMERDGATLTFHKQKYDSELTQLRAELQELESKHHG